MSEEEAGNKQFYAPMLAQKYDDRKDGLEYPLYSQPKLDGIRCIVQRNGHGELTAKTRNGKVIDAVPHILESLKEFFC